MLSMRYRKVNVENKCYIRDIYDDNVWAVLDNDIISEADWLLMFQNMTDVKDGNNCLVVSGERNLVADLSIIKTAQMQLNRVLTCMKFKDCDYCTLYNASGTYIELYNCKSTDIYFGKMLSLANMKGMYTDINLICSTNGKCNYIKIYVATDTFCYVKLSGINSLEQLDIAESFAFMETSQSVSGWTLQSDNKIKIDFISFPASITDTLLNSVNNIKDGISELKIKNDDNIVWLEIYKNNITYDFTMYKFPAGLKIMFEFVDDIADSDIYININVASLEDIQLNTEDICFSSVFIALTDKNGSGKVMHITDNGIFTEIY